MRKGENNRALDVPRRWKGEWTREGCEMAGGWWAWTPAGLGSCGEAREWAGLVRKGEENRRCDVPGGMDDRVW